MTSELLCVNILVPIEMNRWEVKSRLLCLWISYVFVGEPHSRKHWTGYTNEEPRYFEFRVAMLIFECCWVYLLRNGVKVSVDYSTLAKSQNSVEWFLLC